MQEENTITLNKIKVRTRKTEFGEYLCITDLAKVVGGKTGKIIGNWFSLISTIEFLKEWEIKYNEQDFNVLRYQDIRMSIGTVRFNMSAKKWIKATNAKGIISEPGRYGGTYAHNAIALEFCAAISPAFKLGVYTDYIELKEAAAQRWLSQYKFFIEKIETDTLQAHRIAKDLKGKIE